MPGRGGRGGRGRGRTPFGLASGLRPVEEGTRIDIKGQLEAFRASEQAELTFPAGLSNHDRAVVHAEALRLGFKSKSKGKGAGRQVSVFKYQASDREATALSISFAPESHRLVQEYLKRFPPSAAELEAGDDLAAPAAAANGSAAAADVGGKKRRLAGGAPLSTEQIAAAHAQWQARQAGSQARELARVRQALPIAAMREEILGAVEGSQVVLVAGETGCGKTTQVPQFLLERAWGQGRPCKVMCTQPRRLSAVTVAERVAAERGEACGQSVGYTIRLESKVGPGTAVMFCTNGVLLRMLTQGDEGELDSLTHIVMDEVHERDRFADFLLIILKQLLPRKPRLRLVLMSATLHSELFAAYFGGCPVVQVPGFTHPVTDVYLDELLPMIGFSPTGKFLKQEAGGALQPPPVPPADAQAQLDAAIFAAFMDGSEAAFQRLLQVAGVASDSVGPVSAPYVDVPHSKTGGTALMVAAGKGHAGAVHALLSGGADPRRTAKDGSSAADWAARFGHAEVAALLQEHAQSLADADGAAATALLLGRYQATTDADAVDLDLIVRVLEFVCAEDPPAAKAGAAAAAAPPPQTQGAVLVFLPGWDDIIRLKEQLDGHSTFRGPGYSVLPLHSMVPPAEQRKVFVRPPAGVRKIVLATNIAETAVTIDDVVCVVNSGRMKEKSYDPYTAVSTLMATWISKASEKQRRGRAGRCQPGVCFHLYSRQRSQSLQEFQVAELQRDPLDEICLQVKLLEGRGFGSCSLADFLGQALEPPPAAAITNALALLRDVGALERGGEALTQLGRHLARLPLPPRTGKMLLFGLLFGVLDPLLTVACCMAYRSPWVLPIEAEARKAALAAKRRLAGESGGGSDHLALVQAYAEWDEARRSGRERQYAAATFLNGATMNMVHGMRTQLLGELQAQGFVSSLADASRQAGDLGLVRSVLGAALYPQIGLLVPAQQQNGGSGGGGGQNNGGKLITAAAEKVRVHAASLNCSLRPAAPAALAFDERMRLESALFVMQTSLLPPHVLLLVGARLAAPGSGSASEWDSDEEGEDDRLLLDGWLGVRLAAHVHAPLRVLRTRLAACFAARIAHPRQALAEPDAALLALLTRVFGLEAQRLGFGGSAPRPGPGSYAAPTGGRGQGRGPPPGFSRGRGGGRQPHFAGRHAGHPQHMGAPQFGNWQQLPHDSAGSFWRPMLPPLLLPPPPPPPRTLQQPAMLAIAFPPPGLPLPATPGLSPLAPMFVPGALLAPPGLLPRPLRHSGSGWAPPGYGGRGGHMPAGGGRGQWGAPAQRDRRGRW